MSRTIDQDLYYAKCMHEKARDLAAFGFSEASRRRGRVKMAFWTARIEELKEAKEAAK